MSVSTFGQGSGPGRLAIRWLPPLLVLLAVVGIVAVLPSVANDQGDREWYRGLLGGSNLYKLNVVFARIVPFLAGGALALGLLQRRVLSGAETHTADSLQRHGWTEVVTHWLNALGIVLCLITGIFLLNWIDNPLSLYDSYVIHYFGAGASLAAVCHHIAYQFVGGGMGLIPRSRADFKNALAETVAYTGVYRGLRGAFGIQLPPSVRRAIQPVLRRFDIAPDPAGKYLATEKVISYPLWGLLIGIVVITGVIKAFHYLYALPGWLRQAMTFLHDGATYFIIAMLVLHVAALVLVPHNWRLVLSMLTTRVSRRYARERLPLWAEAESDESTST
jgi:cytochrome b subunit of formate dehydrogenase